MDDDDVEYRSGANVFHAYSMCVGHCDDCGRATIALLDEDGDVVAEGHLPTDAEDFIKGVREVYDSQVLKPGATH